MSREVPKGKRPPVRRAFWVGGGSLVGVVQLRRFDGFRPGRPALVVFAVVVVEDYDGAVFVEIGVGVDELLERPQQVFARQHIQFFTAALIRFVEVKSSLAHLVFLPSSLTTKTADGAVGPGSL